MSNFIHEHTTAQTALLGFEECRKEVRKLPESVFMRHAIKCFIRKWLNWHYIPWCLWTMLGWLHIKKFLPFLKWILRTIWPVLRAFCSMYMNCNMLHNCIVNGRCFKHQSCCKHHHHFSAITQFRAVKIRLDNKK